MTHDEVVDLAREVVTDEEGHLGDDDLMFILLVDVADAYLHSLEQEAGDEVAPFFGNTTPLECLQRGLMENLEMRREDRRGL